MLAMRHVQTAVRARGLHPSSSADLMLPGGSSLCGTLAAEHLVARLVRAHGRNDIQCVCHLMIILLDLLVCDS